MPTRIEPTDQQLEHAFQRRRRLGWPATVDQAMAVPLLAALLRGEVVRCVLAERRAARRQAEHAEVFGTPAPAPHAPAITRGSTASRPWPPRRASAPASGQDRKRLAAGDRDDD